MNASPKELEVFVHDALIRGLERPVIRQVMLEAGWTAEQAGTAINAYADMAFPVPVPRPRVQLSAREAFLYLVLFTTLFLSCYHVGSLAFDLINRAFPDVANRAFEAGSMQSMRWSLSSLIIAFPTFVFLARYIGRAAERNPMMRLSPIRRWLTYLTLFGSASTLIGDLTVLVYHVLAGELTTRIALKVLVVLAIAGAVFGYYLSDLRREERE
jgi:hypothetical protein